MRHIRALNITALILLTSVTMTRAHELGATTQPADLVKVGAEMAAAGINFFNALSPDQRKRATFDFASDERSNWAFIPKERKGLPFKQMTAAQHDAAIALLKSGVSAHGFEKADAIMNQLEMVLHDLEKSDHRDPTLYYITLFGKPEVNGTWGWRFEGHHVAINVTIVDGKAIAGAPMFLGANPANVESGPHKGLRVLGVEEDLGRKLVTSLSDDQRTIAVINQTAPRDITTGNQRKITPGAPAGISVAKLSAEQKNTLRDLVQDFAHRLRDELAAQDLKKIDDAGFDNVYFAWAGSVKPGEGHYYRIQGATFMIEYDNTQNNANHVHTVWRDPADDFGEDLLKKHYQEHAHDQK